jgi:hypothetical protein
MYQINLILSVVISIMTVPIVSVFTYIFNITNYVSVTNILYIALALMIIVFGTTFFITLLSKEQLIRKLKPSYQKEFTFISSISAIGVLGSGVLFMYLGGDQFYVPHVIIPLGLITYSIIYVIGDRFFNIRLIRR